MRIAAVEVIAPPSLADTAGDGWAVVRRACAQVRTWLDSGLPSLRLVTAVPLRTVVAPGLVADVAAVLAESALPSETLELELPDTVLAAEDDLPEEVQHLKDIGVRLAVRDLDADRSVLATLRRCPIDTLRIDGRFVREITDLSETPVVRALLTMASDVGLEVVADGVETSVQGAVLRRAGCHLAQGDFFSPPVGAGELERLVRASQIWAPSSPRR